MRARIVLMKNDPRAFVKFSIFHGKLLVKKWVCTIQYWPFYAPLNVLLSYSAETGEMSIFYVIIWNFLKNRQLQLLKIFLSIYDNLLFNLEYLKIPCNTVSLFSLLTLFIPLSSAFPSAFNIFSLLFFFYWCLFRLTNRWKSLWNKTGT